MNRPFCRSISQTRGIEAILAPQPLCQQLALEYAALPGAAALEVAQWLRVEYSFDPACLTD